MIHSFKVLTTLAAQRVVAMVSSTAYTVQYPETAQNFYVGITKDDVLDTTGSIPVAGPGEIAKLLFNETMPSGGLVGADSVGRGIALALPNTTTSVTLASAFIGTLVGGDAFTLGVLDVLIAPGLLRTSA